MAGRPPKIKTPASPSAPAIPALQAQVDAAAQEIQKILREEDMSLVATNLKLAGVQQQYSILRSLLATDVNEQLSHTRTAQGWAEQQVRAAKTVQVDLLQSLWAKAEAMDRHSSALKGLK
ncbi:hypothetical protein [Nannocystis sp. SCPEA4]|uniref:hypothetical protein n=1 Tax=Nannocystis sp. SCPEA4 TaxID=2996787 RepID=UPI00226DE82B|nr:hypothetical protein [Nannocystis sp. SCPEA4]MCY1055428.1 hypothetical protein [Nannocystis sp. SCPEA4]